MTPRTALPRLALGLAIAGAAIGLALYRDRLDPALIESAMRNLGLWAPIGFAMLRTGLVALGLLALAAFIPRIVRRMRAADPNEPAAQRRLGIRS